MEVKFGTEEGTFPNFTPMGATMRVNRIGPTKLKFLLRFDQNVEYKRPSGAYAVCDFHKIRRICTMFQDALAVKISLDFAQGLWSYVVLS